MYSFYSKKMVQPPGRTPNLLRIMKLTTLILVTAILQVSASTLAQKITLKEKNAQLEEVFEKISEQTRYDFLISTETLALARPVTINVQNEELKTVLEQIFSGQPLNYVMQDKMIVVSKKEVIIPIRRANVIVTVSGKVTDTASSALSGASVRVKGTTRVIFTDNSGAFTITTQQGEEIEIAYVGYQTSSFRVFADHPFQNITLRKIPSKLNEVQVIGYGQTTKRFATGSVSTISAKQIEDQPVTNVLSALSGRAPGVFVQTTNGLPGGNINIQIRGQGSISAGTTPLYIIDGVPFVSTIGTMSGNDNSLGLSAINGAVSPFNSINPSDIESISILKDADATSIYGSRGSNGVVLITTKRGKQGKLKADLQVSEGISRAANLPQLLDLQQYLQIRREGFGNDGLTPSADPTSFNYAPELTVWSQTQSTDWAKFLLGNTAHSTDAQTTISGGNEQTNFIFGANFHSETGILPGTNLYERGGAHSSLQHTSKDKKFLFQFSNSLTLDDNILANPSNNLLGNLLMAPNYPVYNPDGSLNWYAINPVAQIKASSHATSFNLLSSALVRYEIYPGLNIKLSAGYNNIYINQTELFPTASLYPGTVNYTLFGNNSSKTVIMEPQVSYSHHFNNSTIDILGGGTYQYSPSAGQIIQANGFSNPDLMENLGSASTYYLSNTVADYKYLSLFGRVTYNFDGKYIINGSVRRDGSSKFGPENRFGTFGAVGAAWIFSEEKFFKKLFPFVSFGKLRGSYGLTGNDQITPYQYLSTYSSSGYVYQNVSGLQPSRIANSDFHWETTRKLDVAVELGFFKDQVLISIDHYQNRSSDQLVSYTIPVLTGFSSYQANLPAVVENKGWEYELTAKIIQRKDFSWSVNLNITVPENRLLSFQNLASSTYAKTLVIGQPITRTYGYKFVNIDPKTGIPQYATSTGSTTENPSYDTDDYFTLGSGMPNFYGGAGTSLRYHHFQLDVFAQYARQQGPGSLLYTPGNQFLNNYQYVDSRWQRPGDVTNVPKASTNYDFYYTYSSANYFNTSYFRIKNVAFSYTFPGKWLSAVKINTFRIYLQGQNLYTFWNHKLPISDPESGALTAFSTNLPPLKSLVAGLQLTF